MPRRPRIGAFPPEAAFLPALARLWLDEDGGHEGLIILPSRRAAQALAGAFLEANEGKALLLPRIVALGNIDEARLLLSAGFSLPPAMAPARRRALLAQLILRMPQESGAPQKLPAAWELAAEFATLLDEADHAGVDLAAALPNLVPEDFAAHWQRTLEFLTIVTHAWPNILASEGVMNPAKRLVLLIEAQTKAWGENPPSGPVWMVAAEGTPAIARMAEMVAGLPQGRLILPGFDPHLYADAWDGVEDSHAQGGIARLLSDIGARVEEVEQLPALPGAVPRGRGAVLSRALLPAAALSEWQNPVSLNLNGLSRLETGDEAQNALAIAMILRQALQTPGQSAALITPDRALAARVGAALKRFGITADDSAGEPLAATPPAVYLRLLARAAREDYAPLPLLALLKHPLATGNLPPQAFRDMARRLEKHALRGPRPPPGLEGLRFRLREEHQAEKDFLTQLERILTPLALAGAVTPVAALTALIEAGETLAATPDEPGPARLWVGEAGNALSALLAESLTALEDMPDMAPTDLPDLLDALLAGQVVRRPRAKDGHPRIAIWGIQEAALQSVDVAVLGGLVEGVWPSPEEPGPWLSRPMRKQAGLPSPELKIGQAAHGFFSLASACPHVILAAPKRRERAPAVPARWLTRLAAMLAGQGIDLPQHEAALWAAQLDLPQQRTPRPRPRPKPPADKRPRVYSISDIATLLADPYAIYARKVLKLSPLDPLDEESDASQFGDVVHAGLAKFFAVSDVNAPDAPVRLRHVLEVAMRESRPREALAQWWLARLERIADWLVETERARVAANGMPIARALEHKGEWKLPGDFLLKGRADRIERDTDGKLRIIDYKTGTVPPEKKVKAGTAPQLPLEAVMAEVGAFGEGFMAEVKELLYVALSGRAAAGAETMLLKKPEELREVIERAAGVVELLEKFADPEKAFLASPHPGRENKYDVYAGVSRRAEWGGEDENVSD
ncbi:double-strand break repair protein AddB [Acidocella aminolytica]|jgi:ATP-dependent helicase/nuclease subunit B|uniref:Nuclease n=1 Tax=Acidocella aminolytica 101 = DSM 11237 TaxID=1120923 RepID=A0A0D6PKM4_9PROT|nr:double-strand break repair protein AddB [Acidocella aminolytica]GAN81753.1 nuclease [Acidocella aminolytica 101 = DSM 11237]GBQ39008.1 nuclease [Acidocella aminolytica 101 = DSM 11237]SHF47211.1 ATP-dependent helicase/nuclease subunit B [Acidocella aminolytica 101 = DSM 11237]